MSLSRGADKGETGIDWPGGCGKDREAAAGEGDYWAHGSGWRCRGGRRTTETTIREVLACCYGGGGGGGGCSLARLLGLAADESRADREEGPKVTRGAQTTCV